MSNTLEPAERSRWNVLRDRVESSDRRVRGGAANATRSLAGAVASLYRRAIERMLATSGRVTSAGEGLALLASEEGTETLADRLQRAVVFAVPVLRRVAKGARFTKVPWVLVVSSAVSTGLTVITGVREVRVLGSLVAHRIEEVTGQPADPMLVKKLTIELYLAPKRVPELSDRRRRLGRLMRRWVLRGAVGRETGRAATKALEAVERLELRPLVAQWTLFGSPSSPPARSDDSRSRGDTRL
jgi:hypothetical protein